MYRIETSGPESERRRLVADAVLDEADFRAIARDLGTPPTRARKTGLVAAREATERERVDSHWDGLETQNTAEVGDWIVTSMADAGSVLRDSAGHANSYVIRAGTFASLYRPVDGSNAFGRLHAAIGTVEALRLTGGFDIVGPWGERQTAPDGYLMFNGADVYGNHAETFDATYEVVA